jgi:SAM-dependent methyltransferase
MPSDYRAIRLSPREIQAEAYKKYLGGGARDWEKRGAFQVEMMRALGLRPEHTLLDVGCGPLRGGIHFIGFLDPGNYRGVDFNPSFVDAAHVLLQQAGLPQVIPCVTVISDFDFGALGRTFDRLLCFSVLNHCVADDRARFFERVADVMDPTSRVVVTHGAWFDPAQLRDHRLRVTRTLETEAALGPDIRFADWGFDEGPGDRLPIVELALR